MKKIILDTNAYIAIVKKDKAITSKVNTSHLLYFSNFVLGELLFGFKVGTKEEYNRDVLQNFLKGDHINVIHTSDETSEIYAELKSQLKKKGRPIPTNDIWIAAQAIEYGAQLITYDKHFQNIDGLRKWPIIH